MQFCMHPSTVSNAMYKLAICIGHTAISSVNENKIVELFSSIH